MRVLITGSRKWTNRKLMAYVLDLLPESYDVLVHGGAQGADLMANTLAGRYNFRTLAYPVDTSIDGPWPAAGVKRNTRMLEDSKPDLCIGFPTADSRGTYDMLRKASDAGVPTLVVVDSGVAKTWKA